jgi:hypothetical protein
MLCMDRDAEQALTALKLRNTVVTSIHEVEKSEPELRATRDTRSHAEYCWTAAPVLSLFCLEQDPGLASITYLDADLEFFSDPAPALAEIEEGSVLLSPHRYSERFRAAPGEEEPGGLFNVQFTTFRADERGLAALRWWRDCAIESCRQRVEPGRFAAQKYLDELPRRFPGVRVSTHAGAGLAPWNVDSSQLTSRSDELFVDGIPLIFHHFQSLQVHCATVLARALARLSAAYRLTNGPVPLVWTVGWRLSEAQLDVLWEPYLARLSCAYRDVLEVLDHPEAVNAPLDARDALFQIIRRRVPTTMRDRYWRLRYAAWRRRTAKG